MSRKEGEALLEEDGDFLVRESTTSKGQYVLSGMQNGQPKHLLLVDPSGKVTHLNFLPSFNFVIFKELQMYLLFTSTYFSSLKYTTRFLLLRFSGSEVQFWSYSVVTWKVLHCAASCGLPPEYLQSVYRLAQVLDTEVGHENNKSFFMTIHKFM